MSSEVLLAESMVALLRQKMPDARARHYSSFPSSQSKVVLFLWLPTADSLQLPPRRFRRKTLALIPSDAWERLPLLVASSLGGVLRTSATLERLLEAIKCLHSKRPYLEPDLCELLLGAKDGEKAKGLGDTLSQRESEVLWDWANGRALQLRLRPAWESS